MPRKKRIRLISEDSSDEENKGNAIGMFSSMETRVAVGNRVIICSFPLDRNNVKPNLESSFKFEKRAPGDSPQTPKNKKAKIDE